MNDRQQPRPAFLPRGLRLAAVLCLILSCVSGLWSAMEASSLASLPELKQDLRERSAKQTPEPKKPDHEMNERLMTAQFAALEPVHESRALLLGALAVSCAVSFVAAGRLLRPAGLSRESMRRMLGGTALVAAVLRTIEGAQWAVVTRNMVGPMMDAMRAFAETQEKEAAAVLLSLVPSLPTLALALNVAQTAVIAGGFALLSQYFRSQRVRDAVVALDGPPSDFE